MADTAVPRSSREPFGTRVLRTPETVETFLESLHLGSGGMENGTRRISSHGSARKGGGDRPRGNRSNPGTRSSRGASNNRKAWKN